MTMVEPLDKIAWPMFTIVDSQKRCKELIVPVLIDGKSVDLEPDTGASVTIIPNHVWSGVLAAKSLQQTDVKLKSYSWHEIPVLGEAKVQVSCGDQQACLPVVGIAGDGPALMARNWLSVLRLHPLNRLLVFDAPWAWTETCQVAFKKLKQLLVNSPLLAHYDPNKPARMHPAVSQQVSKIIP